MEKSIIQDFLLSTLNIYSYINNGENNLLNQKSQISNKVNDTIDSSQYNHEHYNNNNNINNNYINNNNNTNYYNNSNGNLNNNYLTKDNMLFLLIVVVLIYTFIQRERKMLSETNTFKQILNYTPTLIVLEINFNQKIVNTVNPVLTKSASSSNLTQYFNVNSINNVNVNNNNNYNNINNNNNINVNNNININNNNNLNNEETETTLEKYFSIPSFCESLNIDVNEFVSLLNDKNNEQDLQNSKGIVLKSIDGLKKYRFSGKVNKSIFRGLVLDISEEVSELKKLKYILAHDPLTGLPNRYRLDEKIQKFCNKSETELCALYFMDLNKFKSINDTYGHEVGDLVLKHVSNQFKAQKDSNILPIRLSGDEFLIIKRGVENITHADKFISQFTQKVSSSSFTVDGDNQSTTLPIFFSYGGVVFNKSETKVSSIIKSADEKMYQMKKGTSDINVIEFNKN